MEDWREMVAFPLPGRSRKPRRRGLTMVLDKGLGLGETKDLLEIAEEHIDFIKLGFGTSALYADGVLREKIELVRRYGVDIYPGGTFLEIAAAQGKLAQFLWLARDLGFTAVEVSDGTIAMDPADRVDAIRRARDLGLTVLTEVGKKDPRATVSSAELADQALNDLNAGADWVIVEAREFGKNVVIYDQAGRLKPGVLESFLGVIPDSTKVIWEAPLKDQQQELILRFGPDVNLGNIPPQEILSLEALRVGLRGDTLRFCMSRLG
ncbi:MAG: phosphosulfolactate synthase [Thermoanaerobacterales bacterium]|nr:phosphosulfolactate synthase [Bacillota bacterium]MDI6906222.1 phosphosulfolactate synthase [Thermoanaerobacterales bacterium]